MTDRDALTAEIAQVNAEIDALYWTFTRTARGKPPVVVRPDLYARRAEIEGALRQLASRARLTTQKETMMPRPKKSTPPRIGRPPRAGVTADRRFEMRATQAEIDAWARAAGDQPVGAWVRDLANRAAKRS